MRFVESLFIAIFIALMMQVASLGSASAAVDCGMEAASVAVIGDIMTDHVHATTGDECRDGQCNSFTCHCFCHGGIAAALVVVMPVLPNSERIPMLPLGVAARRPIHILPPIRPPQA